jgi:hypothetical protein
MSKVDDRKYSDFARRRKGSAGRKRLRLAGHRGRRRADPAMKK